MAEPIVLDPSGEPSPPTQQTKRKRRLRRILKWLKLFLRPDLVLAFLALLVIAGQLRVMNKQSTIASNQAAIARQQFALTEMQQKLVTRPNVVLITGSGFQLTPWKFVNNGPYKIINVRERDIHFKKFVKQGWQMSGSSISLMEKVLEPGKSIDIPYQAWLKVQQSYLGLSDDIEIPQTNIAIMELHFQREIDDREYIWVQPVSLLGESAWVVPHLKVLWQVR
jgi:hypothetical protein